MPNIGDVIADTYVVECELGRGGMGRVLGVRHKRLGTDWAIKVLKPEAMHVPGVGERFLEEARTACRLTSEHVPEVIDFGKLACGRPFMVMERLVGTDLASVLAFGPVRVPVAVRYIMQACHAIGEAHARGIIHRDIKPANLMLVERERQAWIKVLDFGIADAANANAATPALDASLADDTVLGTPAYMAPEILRGQTRGDARSDIWALGVTLYELIAGTPPFAGAGYPELVAAVLSRAHARLAGVPPNLMAVIDRALAKNVDERFQTVAQLAQALSPFTPAVRSFAA